MSLRLKVVSASNGQRRTLFEKKYVESVVTIGRSSKSTIPLPNDMMVSGKHARIERNQDGYCVMDVGARNGTLLNEVVLSAMDPRPLNNGDVIRLGEGIEITCTVTGGTVAVDPAMYAQDVINRINAYLRSGVSDPRAIGDQVRTILTDATTTVQALQAEPVLSHVRATFARATHIHPQIAQVVVRTIDAFHRARNSPDAVSTAAMNRLAKLFLGEGAKLETAQQVEQFGRRIELSMTMMLEWVHQCLKARESLKAQLGQQNQTQMLGLVMNPLKYADNPEAMGRYILNLDGSNSTDEVADYLKDIFLDLKLIQLNLLPAMEESLRVMLDKLDPEKLDQGGMFGKKGRKFEQVHDELSNRQRRFFDIIVPVLKRTIFNPHNREEEED